VDKLKILIVDDSATYRKILRDTINSIKNSAVVFSAMNGTTALEWLENNKGEVDVALVDSYMPEMNGIEVLKQIKLLYPKIEVIMISGCSSNSIANTIDALKFGALEFISKPSEPNINRNYEIINNILTELFNQIIMSKHTKNKKNVKSNIVVEEKKTINNDNLDKEKIDKDIYINNKVLKEQKNIDVVLIASSTGGPSALDVVCGDLIEEIKCPILIVQHMPPIFTNVMAQSLNKKCKLPVLEGKEGEVLKNGHIYIAPGGYHMKVENSSNCEKIIRIVNTSKINGVRPSADVLFESIIDAYDQKNEILVIVLTGMGKDGLNGISTLKKQTKCYCLTQSEKTCVVYGMPRSVYEAGLSDEVQDLDKISKRINELTKIWR